jgi:hypothetical protein
MRPKPLSRFPLNRRRFLRGLSLGSGARFLTPLLAQLETQAAGGPLPQRVVFVVEGNGVSPDHLVPHGVERPQARIDTTAYRITDADRLREVPVTAANLPDVLEPLAAYADRLSILQGLSGRVAQGGHSVNFGALGLYGRDRGPAGETIDSSLARLLPSPFSHVGLGMVHHTRWSVVENISARGAGQSLPTVCDPHAAYYSLFGSVTPEGRGDFAAEIPILEFVRDDLRRIERHLAGPERAKLDAYAHALETMHVRHGEVARKAADISRTAPAIDARYGSAIETERLEAMFDIGAAAVIAGLTNVLTVSSGAGSSFFEVTFKGLGIPIDKHAIGHGQGADGRTADELARTIRRYHFTQIAKLADKLAAVPEGDGSMLDNTAIVYLSDSAEGHHAKCLEWPVVVLGSLGGRLQAGGRYLEYPRYGRAGHRGLACLYSTLLHACGAKADRFGELDRELDEAMQTGPLGEVLA